MSIADTRAPQCLFYALAGLTGIACGTYLQQEIAMRQLFGMIRSDPYVFHYRHKLYPLLNTFGTDHEARLWNRPLCLTDKIREYLIFPLMEKIGVIFFDKKPAIISTDLLELIKYGLPSTDNLLVHKEYIVSQDMGTNTPKWMCEHLKGNYKKLTTDEDGAELHLRYNDVFVLSNAARRPCKAFQSEIWRKLENHVSQTAEKFGSVYVYTGPMYMPTCTPGAWILDYHVVDWVPIPTPSHYFKVLIIDPQDSDSPPYMEGYIIENKLNTDRNSRELTDYLCDIAEIERHTGLQFFDGVQSIVRFKRERYSLETDRKTIFQYLDESPDLVDVDFIPNS